MSVDEEITAHEADQKAIQMLLCKNGLEELNDYFIFHNQLSGGRFKKLCFDVTRKDDEEQLRCALLIVSSRWLGDVTDKFVMRKIKERGHHKLTDEQKRKKTQFLAEDFAREATLLSHLPQHLNLVRYIDFGIYPRPYLLTELVEGTRLDQVERTPQQAAQDIYHLARGLKAMHGVCMHGRPLPIVHNDVKKENAVLVKADPANIASGYVKLMDLGTSQPVRDTASAHRLGTSRYRAPESYSKERTISTATDIFSLGVVAIDHVFRHYLWNPHKPGDPHYDARAFMIHWNTLDPYENHYRELGEQIRERVLSSDEPLSAEKRNELLAKTAGKLENADALLELFLSMASRKPEERPSAAQVVERLEQLIYKVKYDRAPHESSWDFTPDERFALALQHDRDARLMRGEGSYYHEWRVHSLHLLDAVRSFGDLIMMLRNGSNNTKIFACERIVMPCYPLLTPDQRQYVRNQLEHHLCNERGAYTDIAGGSTTDERDVRSTDDAARDTLRDIREYDAQRSQRARRHGDHS